MADREARAHSAPPDHTAARSKEGGADSPARLPGSSWMDIAKRVASEFSKNRLTMVGASAAFYSLLAVVPALAAFVALYGLVFDRNSIVSQVGSLSQQLAPEVRTIIEGQLTRLASEPARALGLAFAGSLVVSLWSASAATRALMDGLNIVYEREETRGYLRFYGTALLLTLGGIVGMIVFLAASLVVPVVVGYVLPGLGGTFVQIASYLVLLGFLWAGLMALYRWGPSREPPAWRWLAPGTVIAVAGLAIFAVLFSWFARSFAGYSSYGSLGAVIGFMTWMWISIVIVLLGAQIDAEIERQTVVDTEERAQTPRSSKAA